jgi:hypothetical protein
VLLSLMHFFRDTENDKGQPHDMIWRSVGGRGKGVEVELAIAHVIGEWSATYLGNFRSGKKSIYCSLCGKLCGPKSQAILGAAVGWSLLPLPWIKPHFHSCLVHSSVTFLIELSCFSMIYMRHVQLKSAHRAAVV